MPDAYEKTVREIFPDDHPGSFVQLPDGRWIWATFYHFQWDLNYANPAVFRAMAGEMLFLANQGVEVLRMDAVAFIWKRLGTPSRVAARGAPAAAGVQRGAADGGAVACSSSPRRSCTPTR